MSPLKALAYDVERNLRAPLAGIRRTAQRSGIDLPELRVASRTGDTPADLREHLVNFGAAIGLSATKARKIMDDLIDLTADYKEAATAVMATIQDGKKGMPDGPGFAAMLESIHGALRKP